jgi:hypothetical protein
MFQLQHCKFYYIYYFLFNNLTNVKYIIYIRHTFGADTERFKHSFCGRLDIAATLPGPGAYVINRDGDIREEDKVKPTQAFRSKSPHRLAVHKPGTPGPCYYKPAQPVKTAQCTNQDGRWI